MVTDRTEEEQVEALKKWWEENGTQLLIGIVVVLGGIFGFRTWEANTAEAAETATLIYAVTMENHGPWAPHGDASTVSMVDNYNQLVLAGDAMLGQLQDGLEALGKPATLVFFGDHRPTIPGASDPGGEKHTPYVILRVGHEVGEGEGERRRDLTPAQLHQAILDWGRGR